MSEIQILSLLKRIMSSGEGAELIEYLQSLSLENYEAFKKSGAARNDIHKGYAIAIDALLESLLTCNDTPETEESRKHKLEQVNLANY